MPGLFITATGTDIGKTYVAAGLLRAGRRAGLAMNVVKPVLTGYDPASAAASDAGLLLAALGRPLTADTIAAVSPFRFTAPLSPDMAAAQEDRDIDVSAILEACRSAISADVVTLIEGIGGVMVPLDTRYTTLDLMTALACPIVLVSGTYLGAISHCLTAVAALAGRGTVPAHVILNETGGSSVPLTATEQTLRRFCPDITFSVLPHLPPDRAAVDPQAFDGLLSRILPIAASSRAAGSAA